MSSREDLVFRLPVETGRLVFSTLRMPRVSQWIDSDLLSDYKVPGILIKAGDTPGSKSDLVLTISKTRVMLPERALTRGRSLYVHWRWPVDRDGEEPVPPCSCLWREAWAGRKEESSVTRSL